MKKLMIMAIAIINIFVCKSGLAADLGNGYVTDDSSFICLGEPPGVRFIKCKISYNGEKCASCENRVVMRFSTDEQR